uniref:NADH dehydrogenase subunit 2 n=1 Tax=Photinus signaticollis TaxID=3018954 RepID=UPI0023AB0F92|nr:NADH dehydrogenase subunit 2 [Photinus signaticollis]WCD24468.1 NADH dehydrogenase subunit 2 [Photinus signaticollis]
MLFFSSLIMSTLISISSYSWMSMWIGLEINALSIIPILINQKNKISSEAAIKYFFTQAIASTVIMFAIITMMSQFNQSTKMLSDWAMMIMNSSFLMKMGMAPFHFWFPEVLEGLSWMNSLLMLTWQKIAPMILLMYNIEFMNFIILAIIFSMIVSGLMAINQISLRKIMAYSSINHMGWMLSSMITSKLIWLIYLSIYVIMTISIILILNFMNIFFISQLSSLWSMNLTMKLFFSFSMMSLAGIPPFIGFIPKWLTIQSLIAENFFIISLIMIMFTLIMIYVYMTMIMSTLLFNFSANNWKISISQFKFNWPMSMFNFIMLSSFMFITLSFNLS